MSNKSCFISNIAYKKCNSCKDWQSTIQKTYADLPKDKEIMYIVWENTPYVNKKGKKCTRREHKNKVTLCVISRRIIPLQWTS